MVIAVSGSIVSFSKCWDTSVIVAAFSELKQNINYIDSDLPPLVSMVSFINGTKSNFK